MEICKLCKKESTSLENSHIIPDAFWKKVKNSSPGKKNGLYLSLEKSKNQYGQDTHTEELLCWDCEQKLSNNIENYTSKLCLQNPSNIKVKIESREKSRRLTGIDYRKLKLFQMSLLWRASISTKPIYKHIKLLANEEERIRQAIYKLEPLKSHEYGCIMSLLWINSDPKSTRDTKSIITMPYTHSIGQSSFFVFIFGGFEWRFSNPRCSQSIINEELVITETGAINCPLKDVHSDPVLFESILNAYKNQKEGRGI